MPKRSIDARDDDALETQFRRLKLSSPDEPVCAPTSSSWLRTLQTNDLATIQLFLPNPTPHQFTLALSICDAPVIRWMQTRTRYLYCEIIKNLDVYLALEPHRRPEFNWSNIIEWTYESRKTAMDMFGPPTSLHPAFADLDWSYMDKTSPEYITNALKENNMDTYDWLCRAGATYPSDAMVTISQFGTFDSFMHVMATKNLLLVNAHRILQTTPNREIFDFVAKNGKAEWTDGVYRNILRNRWYDMEHLLGDYRYVDFCEALEYGWTRLAIRQSYTIEDLSNKAVRGAVDAFDGFVTRIKFRFLFIACQDCDEPLDFTVPFILKFTEAIATYEEFKDAVIPGLSRDVIGSYISRLQDVSNVRVLLQRWWDRTHEYLCKLSSAHEKILFEIIAERSPDMLKPLQIDAWGGMFPHLHAHFIARCGLGLFRAKFHEWKLWRVYENHWPTVWCDLQTAEKQMVLDTVANIPPELVDSEDLVPQYLLPVSHPLAEVINPKVRINQRFRLLRWRACTVMCEID